MAFEKKVPEWMAEGIEPPESLKTSGFEPGMKPPAAYFNWFMHGMSEAATELQERVDDSAPAPFIVTLSGNKDDGYTIDYTFDEIVGAYNQGRVIRLIEFVPGPAIMEYRLEVAVSDQVVFANSERMYHKTVNIYRNGRITRVDQTLYSDKYPPHYSAIGAEPVGAVSDHNEDENAHDGMFAPASHTTDKNNPHGVTAAQIGAAEKSKAESLTVPASAWTGEGPYTAEMDCTIAKASNNLVVGAGGSLTAEQQAAFAAAMIVCTAQAAGIITLTAFGEKPTIDLPVNVLEVG